MNQSLLELVLHASPVVQTVMVILVVMSLLAWAVAFAKTYQLRKAKRLSEEFETMFWNSPELTHLYNQVSGEQLENSATSKIFESGFKEFIRLKKQGVRDASDLVSGTQRAMKVTYTKEQEMIESKLSVLATVGSSAPYIGLFGTVWGVMDAFASLGDVQNATLAAVAPGISEALIATALGLFAAIPAVIAYNRLSVRADRVLTQYENFAEGFLTIIQRQSHHSEGVETH